MKKVLFTLLFVAIFLVTATGTWATNGNEVKWSQLPDMESGVNIQSTELEPIVADDWECRDPRPVTDVHFWGSYIGWQDNIPEPDPSTPVVEGFMIRIYEDVPQGPQNPYSHPGECLYKERVMDFSKEYVASIKHPDETWEHKYYYSLDLPVPFVQEEDAIYWISISAIMPAVTEFPWGWETSTDHWNDNACGSVSGQEPWHWYEITPVMLPVWYPHETVDMAFELTVQPPPPPPPLEPVKWQQRPDMEQGVNIISIPMMSGQRSAVVPLTVADDWFCLDGSPVSDLHFWGSYPGWLDQVQVPPDTTPGVEVFRIQVYSDAPVVTPGGFSRPDKLLYEVWVDNFRETYVDSIHLPWIEYEHKYRYDLDLPRIFWQKREKTYWLNISAVPRNYEIPWGWESSMDRWNDFAVNGWYVDPDYWWWEPILHPWTKEFIDMSFELTTCKGPIKWLQLPDMANGFNIGSLPMGPVVADDFLCTNGRAIKEVHFWGSYLDNPCEPCKHWQQGNPGPPVNPLPPSPGLEAFKLSFHEDVPAGVDLPYSHPGDQLYQALVDFANVEERYWDSVPHTGGEAWYEKHYPIGHEWAGESENMAFALTTRGSVDPKWTQPPDMGQTGLNNFEGSREGTLLADDFLCTDPDPVTDVHWWGSVCSAIPERCKEDIPGGHTHVQLNGFHVAFFTDLPANHPDNPYNFSIPGEEIYHVFYPMEKILVSFHDIDGAGNAVFAYGIDPENFEPFVQEPDTIYWFSVKPDHDECAAYWGWHNTHLENNWNDDAAYRTDTWWEHKFYYTIPLPRPFEQEEGKVYWLDIGADPIEPGTVPTWYWGWETSKDHWNDNAVRSRREIPRWEDLGEIYGSPIDMAFLLITDDDTRYCKGDFDRDGDVDGTDLAIFAADFGRTDCYNTGDCEGDVDYDGDVDGSDLAVFAADFGRTDCPCALPVNAH